MGFAYLPTAIVNFEDGALLRPKTKLMLGGKCLRRLQRLESLGLQQRPIALKQLDNVTRHAER